MTTSTCRCRALCKFKVCSSQPAHLVAIRISSCLLSAITFPFINRCPRTVIVVNPRRCFTLKIFFRILISFSFIGQFGKSTTSSFSPARFFVCTHECLNLSCNLQGRRADSACNRTRRICTLTAFAHTAV